MSAFYRTLLRLYPSSFREEYAPELIRTYEDAARDRGRVRAALGAVADVVPNALGAHGTILAQDLRYTLRTLSASRGFAVATVLVTALGVGANTATFSVADFVLLRPLAFPKPDEIVRICGGPRSGGGWGCMNEMSPALYRDVVTRNRSFTTVGVYAGRAMNLVGAGEPIRVPAEALSPEVLPLLGVRPLIGRFFDPAQNPQDEATAVIGYGVWQSQFGGDRSIVGTTVNLDGMPFVVIGVMPAHFRWPREEVQLWTPLMLREADFADRGNTFLQGIARLKPGVTFEQARADLDAIADRLTQEAGGGPENEVGFSFFKQRDEMSPRYRIMLVALVGASLALLLLTCANLANLLLARSASRERELAVRAALGAGRERLMRQMLTESLMLALFGGIAGALLAWMTVPLLAQLVPTTLPMERQPVLDVRAFAFAALLSALTGLGFGLVPALRVGARTGLAALREGARSSRRGKRLRALLVTFEVTVSVILLVASGLLIRAVWRVQAVDPGFSTANVLTMTTALPMPKYEDAALRVRFYERVLSGVRALPGVESAAYTSGLPMVLTGGITRIQIPGVESPRDARSASIRIISSQLFETMKIPLRAGRDIGAGDLADRQKVAVVSESFVNRYWPNTDPIGQEFQTRNQTWAVIGVVGDIKVRGLERTNEPQMYIPTTQADSILGIYTPKDLVIRSSLPSASLVSAVRDIIRSVDPQQPISNVRMLADVVGDQTVTRRSQLRILLALAVLALLLAAVGIHGLLAFTVAQRDREIGVRLALGADPPAVARMVVGEGVRMALIGVVPGIALSYVAARGMRTLLFGIPPADPITFASVAVLCFATVVFACMRPAWRAARIQPIAALKAD
ncbi:MAG TPA: ABC transporter permease [Gemmatimonadaceae bacterium]|nr:ABC transporter permease [Gemmatimonadaceae bacterium]